MTMKMEWMRAGDNAPACWACFLIYDDNHVDVLAVIGSNERVDRSIARDAARKLWSDDELREHQMSHRELRRIAYGPR
jgi:hypothetical protein